MTMRMSGSEGISRLGRQETITDKQGKRDEIRDNTQKMCGGVGMRPAVIIIANVTGLRAIKGNGDSDLGLFWLNSEGTSRSRSRLFSSQNSTRADCGLVKVHWNINAPLSRT